MDGKAIGQFIPLILIFVIFYFLLIRPQQKRIKEHKAMVEALARGDNVVTAGGIVGKVARIIDAIRLKFKFQIMYDTSYKKYNFSGFKQNRT